MNEPTEIPDDLPLQAVWKSFAFLGAAAVLLIVFFYGSAAPGYLQRLWSTDQIIRQAAVGAGAGLLFALLVLSLYYASLIKLPENTYMRLIQKLAGKKYGLFTIAVGAGAAEEFLFRGALLGITARYTGDTTALILISLLFMALHIPQYKGNPVIHTVVFMMGAVLGLLFLITEALWAPFTAHAVYNAVLTYLMKKKIKTGIPGGE
ncbi:CPBP family intramembrane glutamic endopeptidase [Salibacterium sp. K-3]